MSDVSRKLSRAWWAVDRLLGGQRRPTRFQKFVARHPWGVGLCAGLPPAAAGVALSDGPLADAVAGAFLGGLLGAVYGLTALGERYRQRRLRRMGLWDGS